MYYSEEYTKPINTISVKVQLLNVNGAGTRTCCYRSAAEGLAQR